MEFTYRDSAGDVTSRTVTLHSVTATHLKGECHDRGAERTFRVDRIIGDVVDLETGEILRARALARHFG
ncbi:WYL domain-containing protein [Stutzerimonas balearica]|uniref:WYL domain-containing protein n=1 Tax=Stutzerimonas balearica TaxID=74829 RepID=UPI00289A0EB5|nr:WYL domain-containing protein [Stutzerimonas balearica]